VERVVKRVQGEKMQNESPKILVFQFLKKLHSTDSIRNKNIQLVLEYGLD